MEGISKAPTIFSVLIKTYTIPCHDRGYINVVLVLQSCIDSLPILPVSSSETKATSSDCACHVGNVKVEKDLDMQVEEEVNVKTEKGIDNEEEEGVGIKEEQGIYSEEEVKEDIDIKEEENAGIKE